MKFVSKSINLRDYCNIRNNSTSLNYTNFQGKDNISHFSIVNSNISARDSNLMNHNHTNHTFYSKIIIVSNNDLSSSNNPLLTDLNDFKKKFFFKEEFQAFDRNSNSNTLLKDAEPKLDKSVAFIQNTLKAQNKIYSSKKVDRKFLDHLTSLHRYHI